MTSQYTLDRLAQLEEGQGFLQSQLNYAKGRIAELESTCVFKGEVTACVPPGFVLVPIEPTEAMLDAYWRQTGESKEMKPRTLHEARRRWSAMLEALEPRF